MSHDPAENGALLRISTCSYTWGDIFVFAGIVKVWDLSDNSLFIQTLAISPDSSGRSSSPK